VSGPGIKEISMNRCAIHLFLIVLLCTLVLPAQAQIMLRDSVLGNGCGYLEQGGNYIMSVTVGQACIGGPGAGFWRITPPPSQIGVGDGLPEIPVDFRLDCGYPNPFHTSTRLAFDVARSGHVGIQVFDVHGRLVRTLLDRRVPAGSHEVLFTEGDLPSGMYWVQMQAGGVVQVQRVVLIR
jgi:hypothetical protein